MKRKTPTIPLSEWATRRGISRAWAYTLKNRGLLMTAVYSPPGVNGWAVSDIQPLPVCKRTGRKPKKRETK